MKRFLFLICAAITMTVQAKDFYYYYRGERIPLTVSEDSIKIYTTNINDTKGDNEIIYTSFISSLHDITNKAQNNITSREYIIKGEEGKTLKMSNRFYVQLFDSVYDVQKLQDVAQKTNTTIIGQVPNIPDWYELIVSNSIFDNSLEISNYFYETGLFKDIDPGFIFDFTPSCLSLDSFNAQWGLPAINACNAWGITSGNLSCITAIIDNGVYYHDEFVSTRFVNAYDCYTDTTIHLCYGSHGTYVCGVIAPNHTYGKIAGVSPNIKIIPISFKSENNDYTSAQLASGFAWAREHGAGVINCSWGDQNGLYYNILHSSLLESEIQKALTLGRDGKGCVVVFSAGNQNSSQLDYPAYVFPEILTVGATTSSGGKLSYSSFGTSLDIVAPGDNILTTDFGGGYTRQTGTSLSAPYVTGIASLMLSINSDLTRQEIVDIIEATAQKIGGFSYTTHSNRPNGTWNMYVGYGLVDAYAAVQQAQYRLNAIQGPDYVCDTTKYYLEHALPSGSTVNWSLSNAETAFFHYSIVGPTNEDTVRVRCSYDTNLVPLTNEQTSMRSYVPTLTATITNVIYTETYQKQFRMPVGESPVFSASSSAIWVEGTPRTFTITNCTDVQNSDLTWTVTKKITPHIGSGYLPFVHTLSYTGRSITYTPNLAPSGIFEVIITATNTTQECIEPVTETYIVRRNLSLIVSQEDGELHVSVIEGIENQQRTAARLNAKNSYTIELWHSIYGLMKSQAVLSTDISIDTTGLPQGVYVLSLKENGEVIAQTKVRL